METVQFIQTTPEDLVTLIKAGVKMELQEFKKGLNTSDPDELLTRKEATDFLKINLSTLFLWTRKGKIASVGISNRRYYIKSQIVACLKPLLK